MFFIPQKDTIFNRFMPTFDNLSARINGDSDWSDTYNSNIHQATRVANEICLIHVTANKSRPLEKILLESSPTIPTSLDDNPGSNTVETEDAFGLGRCFYSYAGRASPQFGAVALAFGPGCEDKHSGNVTPFDTGGFYKGLIKSKIPFADIASRETFVQKSMIELPNWRSYFREFLAAYFTPMSNYWSENVRPSRDDPDEIYYDSDNRWKAWTFEVRFHEGQPIFENVGWCASRTWVDTIRSEVMNAVDSGNDSTPLEDFLTSSQNIEPRGSINFVKAIEVFVQKRVGI